MDHPSSNWTRYRSKYREKFGREVTHEHPAFHWQLVREGDHQQLTILANGRIQVEQSTPTGDFERLDDSVESTGQIDGRSIESKTLAGQ
jgi:hypothetical protein